MAGRTSGPTEVDHLQQLSCGSPPLSHVKEMEVGSEESRPAWADRLGHLGGTADDGGPGVAQPLVVRFSRYSGTLGLTLLSSCGVNA